MSARSPSARFRTALATATSPSPSLSHLQRLADRLPSTSDGGPDLRNPDQAGVTSLHLAANRGRADVFGWLLDEGIEEEEVSRDAAGETVVHAAAVSGHVEILRLYLEQYPFTVDWVNSRSLTPLHLAAMKGQAEAVQLLVENGADINAFDLNGNSPLHYAAGYGHLSVVSLLVSLDCLTESRNNDGFSAADYAYTKALAKELDAIVRHHLEQVKEAKRAARERRKNRSSPETLRSKRQGASSSLSIVLPSPAPSPSLTPDAFNSSPVPPSTASSSTAGTGPSGYGLGLSYQQLPLSGASGSTSPAPPSIPQLGAPIPPTPVPLSPDSNYSPSLASVHASSPFHRSSSQPMLPRLQSEGPVTPRTPTSPYQNTTSPAPSPLSISTKALPEGARPLTPTRSPLTLRTLSRAPSTSSPLSTPTSAGPPSASAIRPSPASALSVGSAVSSSQTATPTPTSPTPASSRPEAARPPSSTLAPRRSVDGYPQQQPLQHPVPISALAAQHLGERSYSSTSSFSPAAGPSPSLPPPPQPYNPSLALSSPPTSPPRPSNNSGGHKLIRKSRSHAQNVPPPSLPTSPSSISHGLPPPPNVFSPSMGGRSVSGPVGASSGGGGSAIGQGQGRGSIESTRSAFMLPFLHSSHSSSHSRSQSDLVGGGGEKAGGGGAKEEGRKGSKLKKEKHGGSGNGGLGLRRSSTTEGLGGKEKTGSRFARALGIGKKA